MIRTALVLLVLLATPLLGDDAPYLVRDFPGSLTPSSSLFSDSFWTTVGDTTWFVADARDGWGRQVWKTNGTEEGTVQVTQIAAPRTGHALTLIGLVNDRLVYDGEDYEGGQLFSIDLNGGQSATLMQEKKLQPAFLPGVMYKGELYFPAFDIAGNRSGIALGKTDGTAAGTTFLTLNEGLLDYSVGRDLTVVGDSIFFVGHTTAGSGAFLTNGTRAGTKLIVPMPQYASPPATVSYANKLIFATGTQLWGTDGTAEGTVVLLDNIDQHSFSVRARLDDKLVFDLKKQNEPRRTWITDGTPAGTQHFDPVDSRWTYFPHRTIGGKYFFFGRDTDTPDVWDEALFTSTAVPGPPTKVIGESESVTGGHVMNGRFYFRLKDAQHGKEWWSTDGTAAGTHIAVDIHYGPGDGNHGPSMLRGDGLLIGAGEGLEPWLLDAKGAKLLKNIAFDAPVPSSNPKRLSAGRDQLFFTAADGYEHVLGRSNGSASGTTIDVLRRYSLWLVYHFVASGNRYYFSTNEGFFSTDGTEAGTVKHAGHASGLFPFRDGVLFTDSAGTVWFTDGTIPGTREFGHANRERPLLVANDVAWMQSGTNIAVTDGIAPMKTVTPNPALGQNVTFAAGPANTTYFTDYDYVSRAYRLWRTDGTADGTRIVKTFDGVPSTPTASAEKMFFVVNNTLWVSDGSEAGTVPLPATGSVCSEGRSIAAIGNRVYWYTLSAPGKQTLWQSDGTAAGTVNLFTYATPGANCTPIAAFRDRIYFSAFTSAEGDELWVSDGTSGGTRILADIFPGVRGSEPRELTVGAGHLFFTADSPGKGRELWAIGDRQLPRRRGVRK